MSIKSDKINNLQICNPTLAIQWHSTKNGSLTPKDVTQSSNLKVWWLCRKGHEWEATVGNRYSGRGCPYCSNQKVNDENCLQTTNPTLSKEWHPTKNGNLTPRDVTAGISKKAWWVCEKGHEWDASIYSRNSGVGCPYCSNQKVNNENCLQTTNPALAKEWHPTKNSSLTPRDITQSSGKKVWWVCEKGHEWEVTVDRRNRGAGCPYCANKKVNDENCLQTNNPNLANEWHPTKNGSLTPKDVTSGSDKKAWWVCKRGHEWETSIYSRNSGKGCPFCRSQTSQLELRVFTELKHIFGNVEHRKQICGVECDVYIPTYKVGIEIDGVYYHKEKYARDKEKTKQLLDNGIDLIRLREKGLKRISDTDIFFITGKIDFSLFKNIAETILSRIDAEDKIKLQLSNYIEQGKIANDEEYAALLYMLPSPFPELSLEYLNADVSKEWHPTKNSSLTPRDVTQSSNLKVWWQCSKGHEWEAQINSRDSGRGCPYCSNQKVNDENCLQTTNPTLAKEWHPTKNSSLTPRNVTQSSGKKVWWVCEKGHEWQANIASRNSGIGCPYCSNKKVNDENCLQTTNPTLSKEWHPTKNGRLTPRDVTQSSDKKVWWICEKDHEWEVRIANRNKGTCCPYCSNKKVNNENCLQTTNPTLSKEWHPTKNGSLTPKDVTSGSDKKAWWVCEKGHEWKSIISNRTKGRGCRRCGGRVHNDEHCLQVVNPTLSKEWHPTKNGNLTPSGVTPNSNSKVWWLCVKGHEWEAKIASRNSGGGCPFCSNKKVNDENCLQTTNPALAKEWHPTKNSSLTPRDVTQSSGKKVWWVCEKGHEWEATIGNRNKGGGCPFCSNKKVNNENCLQTTNPTLSKEWHPTKNGSLTPKDVTSGSDKKAWWVCKRGHQWESTIDNRNKGKGCPACYRQIRKHLL